MLDLMWHLRGSIALHGSGPNDAALDRVERFLERQRKRATERGRNYIAFDDPLWSDPFALGWPALALYDRGRFWIEEGIGARRLRYDLRSLHVMVFCLFGALMFFFFGLADSGIWGGLKWAATAFAWVYGANVLSALARAPLAIRKVVQAA